MHYKLQIPEHAVYFCRFCVNEKKIYIIIWWGKGQAY